MTSYSGLFDNEFGVPHTLLSASVNQNNARVTLKRLFGNRAYGRGVAAKTLIALIGAAAGDATAASTHKRVQAVADVTGNEQGGDRTIETFTGIDRVTTAADVTSFDAALALSSKPTYAVDRSGNGGGGKLGV